MTSGISDERIYELWKNCPGVVNFARAVVTEALAGKGSDVNAPEYCPDCGAVIIQACPKCAGMKLASGVLPTFPNACCTKSESCVCWPPDSSEAPTPLPVSGGERSPDKDGKGREWVSCPICREPDMRLEDGVIHCVNMSCPSNRLVPAPAPEGWRDATLKAGDLFDELKRGYPSGTYYGDDAICARVFRQLGEIVHRAADRQSK
jgi:hypothetical protein